MLTAPAGISPTSPPDTTSLEELTWEEIRDLMKAGKTTVIIPTGGTEKNGYHMVLGKHNYVVAHNADLMARRLKNALVAPTVKWVPEGNEDSQCPGCLVANKLNEEWKGTDTKVYALTDYYNQSRIYFRAWLQAAFGYDEETSGSHAGITDTSQMLFVRPTGIRKDQIKPWGGPQDSGVSGDPMKATPDIGKMGVEFKVNAGLNQYKLLKNPPQRGGRGGNPGN
jgi:creatinine amidohydrolase/Fe(II)-dependent formamide hydrolase-like protein